MNTSNTETTAKIRVYGKAQNRTALGIMHGYMTMHPEATLDDLRQAFPNDLNTDKGVKENFIYVEEKGTEANWEGYFKGDDEVLTMGDGRKVAVVKMWTKTSFGKLVDWAVRYDIIVAQFEAAEGGGKRGSFRLEYLNGYVPPVVGGHEPEEQPEEKKKSKWWLWLLLLVLLGALAAYFMTNKEPKVVKEVVTVEKVVRDTVAIVDTVYVQQLEEIEDKFNAAQFEKGKADLTDDAKFVLYDLVKVLENNADLKIKLVGHTSAEGDAAFNNKLSEDRAKAAVDFVISRGIAAERLGYEGKGSSELLNKENPLAPENRRTEIIVME